VMYGLPEAHTDFIFTSIGEELGLVGTYGVLGAFGFILICGAWISGTAPTRFGKILGCSITALLSFEAIVNIAVMLDVFPNKGLPLPFVSYGGTSMVMSLACIGILLGIHSYSAPVDRHELREVRRKQRWTPRLDS
jgi:cell division protein FtsW